MPNWCELFHIFSIFHAVDTGDAVACSSIISTPEVHCAAVGSISSTKIRQESETVVQSHFPIEHRISFSSNECAEIFASEDALNANRQVFLWNTDYFSFIKQNFFFTYCQELCGELCCVFKGGLSKILASWYGM